MYLRFWPKETDFPVFESVSDKSSEYLLLKENLQRCRLDNGCGARLTYHPHLFDLSLI